MGQASCGAVVGRHIPDIFAGVVAIVIDYVFLIFYGLCKFRIILPKVRIYVFYLADVMAWRKQADDIILCTVNLLHGAFQLVYSPAAMFQKKCSIKAKEQDLSVFNLAELPEEWLCKIKERKILLFGVNGAFLLEHGSKAIDKLKSAMEQIESAAGLVCLFAPGPDIDQIKDINADFWHDYAEFAGSIENKENVIYDYGHDAGKYIRHMSAYYGTAGSLAHKCRNMGKPVMLMSIL